MLNTRTLGWAPCAARLSTATRLATRLGYSTATTTDNDGSSQPSVGNVEEVPLPTKPLYQRGRYGYAPGFTPPENSRAAPPPPKPLRSLDDLPTPNPKTVEQAKEREGSIPHWRASMTSLRHKYARDTLAKEHQRQDAQAARNAKERARLEEIKAKRPRSQRQHHQQQQHQLGDDPLAPENLLREPNGISSSVTGLPIRQPLRIDIDLSAQRKKKRDKRAQKLSRERTEMLLQLYHKSSEFVTEDNLEDAIALFINSSATQPLQTLGDLLTKHRDPTDLVDDERGRQRVQELKNILDGTTLNGLLGVEAIQAAKEKQSSETDPTFAL